MPTVPQYLLSDVWGKLLQLDVIEEEFPELSKLHDPVTQLPQGVRAEVKGSQGLAVFDSIRDVGQC